MSIDFEDDIFQDFLIEAGEILDSLGEQLVDLEHATSDSDLLNSIFRGFHTIKGGAGFLNVEPMVEVCHQAEDIFNLLRQGDREVTADLMDVILEVVDILGVMFNALQSAQAPENASQQLLDTLILYSILPGEPGSIERQSELSDTVESELKDSDETYETDTQQTSDQNPVILEPESHSESAEEAFDALLASANPDQTEDIKNSSNKDNDLITDQEFENLLDDLHGSGGAPGAETDAPGKTVEARDTITEDEFEDLLDALHGSGGAPGATESKPETSLNEKTEPGLITEDEFENLLDTLHGTGQAPGQESQTVKSESDSNQSSDSKAKKKPKAKAKAKTETKPKKTEKARPPTASAKAERTAPTPAKKAETMVRVNTERLDEIMNLVGELVLVRNHLSLLTDKIKNDEVGKAVSSLDQVTSDLQTSVMKTRMQPVKKVFGRFPRVVRDLARQLGKEVDLIMVGEETDLDKNLVEALADPLVHLVRNSVDHGLELPDEREAKGKPRKGKVVLSAEQEGDHILLRVDDDGKGMDPDILRKKAVEKGVVSEEEAASLSDTEAFNIIFMAGFSTKNEISDVSGRGVGMDVVRTKLSQLSAAIVIDSQVDRGTSIQIKVPLTLAIMPALMVVLDGQRYALALSAVHEIFDFHQDAINTVDGQDVLLVRESTLPLFYLRNWIGNGATEKPEHQQVVTIEVGNRRAGFVVDELLGQEEIVIKPLGPYVSGLPGFAGASVGGDGKISLIVDIPTLMKHYA